MSKIHVQYTNKRARRKLGQILAAFIQTLAKSRTSPTIVLIGGPGGSGKSTVATMIAQRLDHACVLPLDDYKTSRAFRSSHQIFGPHPKANEMDLIKQHLAAIAKGQDFKKPAYNRKLGKISKYVNFTPKPVTIVEGEVATYKQFRKFAHLTIFVDAHWKTLLNARLIRDIHQRGYDKEKTIETFLHSNLREFEQYGADSKRHADIHLYCDEDFNFFIESIEENLLKQHHTIFEKSITQIDRSHQILDIPVSLNEQGDIDLTVLNEYLNALFHQGVHHILVGHWCGEYRALTKKEKKILIQSACEFFPGKITCYIPAENIPDTTDFIHYAQEYGADEIYIDLSLIERDLSKKSAQRYRQELLRHNDPLTFSDTERINLKSNPVQAKKQAAKIFPSFPSTARLPFLS